MYEAEKIMGTYVSHSAANCFGGIDLDANGENGLAQKAIFLVKPSLDITDR